jgi:hypothetical protein
VERWFAELTVKQIRRGTFRNVLHRKTAIQEFINAHQASPSEARLSGPKVPTRSSRASPGSRSGRSIRGPRDHVTNHGCGTLAPDGCLPSMADFSHPQTRNVHAIEPSQAQLFGPRVNLICICLRRGGLAQSSAVFTESRRDRCCEKPTDDNRAHMGLVTTGAASVAERLGDGTVGKAHVD